jgi:hypothetical protein
MHQTLWRRVRSRVARHVRGARLVVAPNATGIPALLTDEELRQQAEARGYHLVRRHYYSPIPDVDDCSAPGFWDAESQLPGVDMNDAVGLDLLANVFPKYLEEFRVRYPVHQQDGRDGFYLINGVYMAVDAHVYYALVRHLKPRRIIEIGSGESTRLAMDATAANSREGHNCTVTAVEPYPNARLKQLAHQGSLNLVEAKVQDVGLELFQELQSGDILFIDSTHVLREGNDVQFEYLELLPRLPEGVYVHVHDISLPRRYAQVYMDQGIYWNEQYLLQAFLAFNSRFEVVWPGNYLLLRHPEAMHAAFPEIAVMRQKWPSSEPTAFWMRTRAAR